MKRFPMFTYLYAGSFWIKTFSVSITGRIFTKPSAVSESSIKIKVCVTLGTEHSFLNDPYNFQRPFNLRLLLTFCLILTKVAQLRFLEITLKCLKTGQKWYLCDHPVNNNSPLKFWKNGLFHGAFSCKIRKFKF